MTEEVEGKRVLIITYYWPPSGGSGVQRWLKFVKYLPHFGWQPYVFTPENPSFDTKDESLLKDVPAEAEVLHFPIWEPYNLFNALSGKKTDSKNANSAPKPDSLFNKLSIWVRGNLFIPDPRIFWVRPSVAFLHDFLREQKIRTIITTGPPHSVHLIGRNLKVKSPSLKWIADFRDPWSEWGFLETVKVGSIAKRMHQRMERSVLEKADKVITITPFYVRHFERLGKRKVNLFTNGYDEEDFRSLQVKRTSKFVIRHVGIVNDLCNPLPLLLILKALCQQKEELRSAIQIDFVGTVNASFQSAVESDVVLKNMVTFTPTVPHQKVIELYGESTVLLLVLTGYKDAEGYMPGKLFEYMATGLPILAVGPTAGDAATLLTETGAGSMMKETDEASILAFVTKQFENWKAGIQPSSSQASTLYSRKSITQKLADIL